MSKILNKGIKVNGKRFGEWTVRRGNKMIKTVYDDDFPIKERVFVDGELSSVKYFYKNCRKHLTK